MRRPKSDLALVALDLNETIIPSELYWRQRWLTFFQQNGLLVGRREWSRIGHDGRLHPKDLVAEVYGQGLADDVEQLITTRAEQDIRAAGPRAGVINTLLQAQDMGATTAIVTTSSTRWLDNHVPDEVHNLVDLCVTRDDAPRASKAHLYAVARAFAGGVSADQALAFDDSPRGLHGALQDGWWTASVPTDVNVDEPYPSTDWIVSSLEVDLSRMWESRPMQRAAAMHCEPGPSLSIGVGLTA